MKITKTQLKQIIKEELDKVVGEQYRSGAHWSEQDYYIPKHKRTHGGEQVGEHGDQKEEAARAAWSQDNPGHPFPGDVRGSEPFEHGGRTYGGKGEPDPDADDDDYYTAQKQYQYSRDKGPIPDERATGRYSQRQDSEGEWLAYEGNKK